MRTLVFGLTSQVGDALWPHLSARGEAIVAVSRHAFPAHPVIDWRVGMLQAMPALPDDIGTILSMGPLDLFADWFAQCDLGARRVLAIGSTGIHDKRDSPDPVDRDIAERLAQGEARLFAAAAARGVAATVLRPTLLYGGGRDRSLTPLAALARRWRVLPLPRSARGLRQPVHVEDVAGAMLAALPETATHGRAFDLPGGELLRFDAMVRRAVAARAPGARVVRLPDWILRTAAPLAGRVGADGWGAGSIARMARDQVADPTAAAEAFGYAPRAFSP